MLVNISQSHPIFLDCRYLQDIVPFQLMECIKQNPLLLVSDETDFILGMASPEAPVWIWTAADLSAESAALLTDYFYETFQNSTSFRFVARPEVADMLVQSLRKHKTFCETRIHMESYENKHPIFPKNVSFPIETASSGDVNQIAECMAAFEFACHGKAVLPADCVENAKKFVQNSCVFIIKDGETVAAMARTTRETETHVSISGVYTRPNYRGSGLATALAAQLSRDIISRKKAPILYADLSNPCSNRAYLKAGFTPRGKVDEVTLFQNK